jgi:transcriptional regulator with XRE-family HTH domain
MAVRVDTDRIKQLRRERAMSQEELAAAAGLSVRTIQRIETEGIASLESKKALAVVFGVALETLDDLREERQRYLVALKGGTILGMAGALVGGASGYLAISLSFRAGEMTASDAGVAYGAVGAIVGLTCALIGVVSQKLRTRAAA